MPGQDYPSGRKVFIGIIQLALKIADRFSVFSAFELKARSSFGTLDLQSGMSFCSTLNFGAKKVRIAHVFEVFQEFHLIFMKGGSGLKKNTIFLKKIHRYNILFL